MAKSKRARRSQGHPAKVSRRREREQGNRSADVALGRLVSAMQDAASQLTSALDAELWASALLGRFWAERWSLPLHQAASDDYVLTIGAPLIDRLARRGGRPAAIALRALAAVDEGELGLRAGEHAESLTRVTGALPAWADEIGKAEVLAAAIMREDVYDDACTVFLEARHPGGETHALGVLIDNNLGVMAKDVLVVDRIADVERVLEERSHDEPAPTLEALSPAEAAARIHAAIALTDMTLEPPVDEDYAPLRALALLRADETPGVPALPERAELTPEERERLREEFLAAPEAEGFAADGEEAFVASLIIDFCADYVDGRPLRWSPVVVELFMADWFPRKVLADEATEEAVPPALDAWVRFAGRKRGLPDWAIQATCAAIPSFEADMRRNSADPEGAGSTRALVMAAVRAGVDLSDAAQLESFIAGWNARPA